jgi:hypothetical protein
MGSAQKGRSSGKQTSGSGSSMLMRPLEWLHDYFWLRFAIFFVSPAIAVLVVYAAPEWAFAAAVTAGGLLLALIVYLAMYRRKQLPIVLTIAPNSAGPLLANSYVAVHYPHLEETLKHGGATLVALAFFWASYVAVIIYVASKPMPRKIDVLLPIGLALMIVFTGSGFATTIWFDGPGIFGGHEAPGITPLFAARVLITLYGAYEAISAVDPSVRSTT